MFVHGLLGHPVDTWTHANGTYWPRHLLPYTIPRARIFTFGCGNRVVRDAAQPSYREYAKALALDLMSTLVSDLPIILVAHSAGGLVVEHMVTYCHDEIGSAYGQIIQSIKGIVFMGTPLVGSGAALMSSYNRIKAVQYVNIRTDQTLERQTGYMVGLQRSFQRVLCHYARSIKLFCFHEELPTRGTGLVCLCTYPVSIGG